MEEKKIQQLHDTLSKLRKSAGLGMATQYNFHSSAPMKTSSDGSQIRQDGLPNNALYANFLKEGSWDRNTSSAAKYGDGRAIKRNFDDCHEVSDSASNSSKDIKSKRKMDRLKKKEEKKAAKKAAKLEAKIQAKLEEKRKLKLEQKRRAKASFIPSENATSNISEKYVMETNDKEMKEDECIKDGKKKKKAKKSKKVFKDDKNTIEIKKDISVINDESTEKKEKKNKKGKEQSDKKEKKKP